MNWHDLSAPTIITLALIGLGSIAAVVIAVERLIFLRGFSQAATELHQRALRALARGDAEAAREECDRSGSPTAGFYRAGLDRIEKPDRIPDAVDRSRREIVGALRAPLWVLATLGAIMPFVGLFGTVVGILGTFQKIAASGQGGFTVVAKDISEALVATAAGILVAVEAVVLYNFFQAKVSQISAGLTARCDELVEAIEDRPRERPARPSAARPAAEG